MEDVSLGHIFKVVVRDGTYGVTTFMNTSPIPEKMYRRSHHRNSVCVTIFIKGAQKNQQRPQPDTDVTQTLAGKQFSNCLL